MRPTRENRISWTEAICKQISKSLFYVLYYFCLHVCTVLANLCFIQRKRRKIIINSQNHLVSFIFLNTWRRNGRKQGRLGYLKCSFLFLIGQKWKKRGQGTSKFTLGILNLIIQITCFILNKDIHVPSSPTSGPYITSSTFPFSRLY